MKNNPLKVSIHKQYRHGLALTLIGLLIAPFHVAAANPGKTCSIKLPEIHFTKCLNDAEKNASITGEAITLKSDAKKDFFNDPDGKLSNNNAPVLLAKVDNTKPFTLTAKVSPELKETYDAGALYIFLTEKLWQKFAFERDERGTARIVSVRTIETSDDNNHQPVGGKSAYLKISSDTHTVALYFSEDKIKWNLARLYKNTYPSTIWVGVSSQSPIGRGNFTLFETLSLTTESVKDFRLGI
jgi:regulation of enolase protein 1 (concanavalin A-like superfamily)